MKRAKKIILVLCCVAAGCIFLLLGFYHLATKQARLDENKLLLPETQILLYDNKNEKIPSAYSFTQRTVVKLNELPTHLPAAFICTEDKRFYKHGGFDLIGIARASLQNLKSGRFSQGASTISQQLIKNTHLTLDKTINRKLKEIKLTRQLERRYSKEEILEIYLNTIYFGHNRYGIADAAEFYFHKPPQKLTPAESALLAALVKAPNHYSPFKNEEKALARRNTVLRLMREQNVLSKKEYEIALNTPLPASYVRINARSYAHFAIEEMDQILEQLGAPSGGKIEVFTYLNPKTQALLEEELGNIEGDKIGAVIENGTRGYAGYYSTIASVRRSPGSLIKPLLVYAPAFEEGICSPASPILDKRTDFNGYAPKNFGNEYNGYVSARTAIAKSLNVPAVKTLNSLSLETANAYAEKMGLEIPQKDRTLALALGGMEYGYTFQALLNGYSVFTHDGRYAPCRFIREIRQNGQTIYQYNQQETTVFSPETAYLITDVLRSAVKDGTAKRLRSLPFPVAAKTGTVGVGEKNTDAYTVAYTSEHIVGIWLGNADNTPIEATGGGLPCECARGVFAKLYDKRLPDGFDKPTGIREVPLDLYAYQQEQRLVIAENIAPISTIKREIFDVRYAPMEISTRFSSPRISTPTIALRDKQVRIAFEKAPPDLYQYRIIREANGKTEIVYDGDSFIEFLDNNLQYDTAYQYAVQPYFGQNFGTAIYLPTVFTPKKDAPPIADKPWWNA